MKNLSKKKCVFKEIYKENKVLIFVPTLSIGGAEKNVIMMSRELLNHFESVVLAIGRDIRESPNSLTYDPKSERIRCVYLNCSRARFCVGQALRLVANEKPSVVILNLGFVFLAPVLRATFLRLKIIVRFANTLSSELGDSLSNRLVRRFTILVTFLASDFVVLQSNSMRSDLKQLIPVKLNKTRVIRNPPEEDFLVKSKSIDGHSFGNFIFSAATNKVQKRIDVMILAVIEVLNKSPGINFVVAGVSFELLDKQLRQSVINSGCLERIFFLGLVNNVYPLIKDALLCISSSEYEGSSNFLLECRALGKLCVVTDCPGDNREIFADYSRIIFTISRDTEDLARGILYALEITKESEFKRTSDTNEIVDFVRERRKIWKNSVQHLITEINHE